MGKRDYEKERGRERRVDEGRREREEKRGENYKIRGIQKKNLLFTKILIQKYKPLSYLIRYGTRPSLMRLI